MHPTLQPLTGPRAIITQNVNPSAQVDSCDLSSDDHTPRKRTRGTSEASHDSDGKGKNATFAVISLGDRPDHDVAVKGQADSDELIDLRARVKQLEENNETLRKECTRYRVFWIAECRLKDLMEAGHYTDAISQPRWMASSPERDYDEDAMEADEKELTWTQKPL
ncbi:hypothetical protein FIBSPDRAFT_963718 [Athelia psychrophila]|uniref:Uncharacterized protein n=1 Tax=Athelia psychrophila TaxID=1759441 RepID=A0A165YPC8_9AGAM|nr:hypothetical protein FIBSPDRAFT_963718 [Fibularhizoctonia sp. CBS 109695]